MNKELLKKRLSIGHNGNPEFVKIIDKYHEYIHDIYIAPAGWVVQSTRPNNRVYSIGYDEMIKTHIKYSREKNYKIKFSLLLNSQSWNGEFRSGPLLQKIIDYVKLMDECFDEFVVSDEFIAKELKNYFPDKLFSASVISAINDVETCVEMLNLFPDYDTICVGHKMTFKRDELSLIKKTTKKKVKLLINQGCYYSCPDYTLHSVSLGQSVKCIEPLERGKTLYCDYMNSEEGENGWKNLTHQALSPKFLNYYKDSVDIFKLSTRIENDIDRIDKIIESYITGDDRYFAKKLFMGGGRNVSYRVAAIFSLVDYTENYIEVRNNCKNQCHKCSYCYNLWKKAEEVYNRMDESDRPEPSELFFRDNSPGYPI